MAPPRGRDRRSLELQPRELAAQDAIPERRAGGAEPAEVADAGDGELGGVKRRRVTGARV